MSVRRSAGGVWIEKRKKKDMSLILCIETGTDICSVGLARDGELISLRESDQGRDHARQVGVFVDELLSQTGIAPEELDAVAVGKGPGSYTGLRIGVSFAKGLCYGLRIPLVAIGSLDAFSNPGPRNDEIDVRLALSNEALKMISTPSRRLMSASVAATVSSNSADSITQGPAIKRGFLSMILSLHSFQKFLGGRQIFGRVDADGLHVGDTHADPVAVLQPAQLFQ